MTKIVEEKEMSFEEAINNTPDVAGWYCAGIRALSENDKKRISAKGAKGSLAIDKATKKLYPDGDRWDYAIESNGEIHYVEVHGAERTGRIGEVERKLGWLKKWLRNNAIAIDKLQQPKRFHWVATGEIDLREATPASKQKKKVGLVPKKYIKIGD